MSKDDRIVVRMSAELRAWVHEQAQLGEQDDAAFVRMVLSNVRRGAVVAPLAVLAPAPVAAKSVRDVLDVATITREASQMLASPGSPEHEARVAEILDTPRPAIDVDAMVADTLDEAEAQGLTEPQIADGQDEMPEAGVRPLFRRPVPFSPGNQHARLEQFFGGQ